MSTQVRHDILLSQNERNILRKLGNGNISRGVKVLTDILKRRFPDGISDDYIMTERRKQRKILFDSDAYGLLRRYGHGKASYALQKLIAEYLSLD